MKCHFKPVNIICNHVTSSAAALYEPPTLWQIDSTHEDLSTYSVLGEQNTVQSKFAMYDSKQKNRVPTNYYDLETKK